MRTSIQGMPHFILYIVWLCSSCNNPKLEVEIILPDHPVSIFDLCEDIQFLRLGDTLQEESLFSKVQNAYFLDSFIVFGQNGMSYPDHGQYYYFDYDGNFLHRFNSNEVVKDGLIFATGFYANEEGVFITDKVRNTIFHTDHYGNLVEFFDSVNKASLYLPISEDTILYSYNRDKPMGLLDDHDIYDFFLYSEESGQIFEKGVRDIPEWLRVKYGDIQLIKSPNNGYLYHCTVRDPDYIIYEMTPRRISEIDRLVFYNAMIDEKELENSPKKRQGGQYYRDANVVTDVFAIQRVNNEIFCMIDRGFGTNYLVRKNLETGESRAVQIDWLNMVARDYVLRARVLDYTKNEFLVMFSPATTFKPFYDQNKELLQPFLKNDFTDFSYSDNDVMIFLKFKKEHYDM